MRTDLAILGDWGTSRLRLFLRKDEVTVDTVEAAGIAELTVPPAAALRAAVAGWFARFGPCRITLCGMGGSRNGLIEVPYLACPADASRWAAHSHVFEQDDMWIRLAAGLTCRAPTGAPDVMRGEETQIFGALELQDGLRRGRQIIVLPGTHSKWAVTDDGRVSAFQTFPTGELFALLRDHSTLARAHLADTPGDTGFSEGLARAAEARGVLGKLFEARSAQLIDARSRRWALGLLSGLLIGHELRDGLERFGAAAQVTIIGDPALAALYTQAFASHSIETLPLHGNDCVLAGLRQMMDDR